ncbi:MAG: fibrobacter succinogenes major paralogous domain-containing protein [Candidatus Fibromonas sp.]|nr:fibrobacter succinogenes major paralogous domain-containing protein [Candidatus Fibromonas sp.]
MVFIFLVLAYSGYNTVTYGGQTYKTVKIGGQVWFAENLNYNAKGSVCYGDNPDNCVKYGRLYDWETALEVCPEGWHLPSNAEWDKLLRFIDGDTSSKSPHFSFTAGKHLKAVSGWNNGGNGTDTHGFSALPGGNGNSDGSFYNAGDFAFWWGASDDTSYNALYDRSSSSYTYRRYISYDDEHAYWDSDYKSSLYSVRCVFSDSSSIQHSNIDNGTFTDKRDSKTYRYVTICSKTWMAENMNYKAEGSVCYDNDPDNCAKYGRLYNWETAMNVCPDGWHLPSNAEWDKLSRSLEDNTCSESLRDFNKAGKYLKAASGWNFKGNGTDDYGFSALPGGSGRLDGSFYYIGYHGTWWISGAMEEDSSIVCNHKMDEDDSVNLSCGPKNFLHSVRCVKD